MTPHSNSIAVLFILSVSVAVANTQDAAVDTSALRKAVERLENNVRQLEYENKQLQSSYRKLVDESGGTGAVLILFGTVCALWAQNTGRNPWLWFFLGLFFSVITILFLLSKNAADIRDDRRSKLINEEPPQ